MDIETCKSERTSVLKAPAGASEIIDLADTAKIPTKDARIIGNLQQTNERDGLSGGARRRTSGRLPLVGRFVLHNTGKMGYPAKQRPPL